MKSKLYTICTGIIGLILTLLGFSSCDGRSEYGTPSATFKVRAVAADKSGNAPVKGLQAVLYNEVVYDDEAHITDRDMVITNADGELELKLNTFPTDKLYLKLEDIDGEENGLFRERTIEVDFKDAKYKGGSGGWYKGEASKDLGTILMEETEPPAPIL